MHDDFIGYYFAYGSNLHREQMSRRCPAAEAIGRLRLRDWQVIFRGVADCVPSPGAVAYGAIWQITAACEVALDRYEGVERGLYRKEYVPIATGGGGFEDVLIYTMNSTGVFPPSAYYLQVIRQGYRDFAMPKVAWKVLSRAVADSWDDKAPSHHERQRHRRDGRPELARQPGQLLPVPPTLVA